VTPGAPPPPPARRRRPRAGRRGCADAPRPMSGRRSQATAGLAGRTARDRGAMRGVRPPNLLRVCGGVRHLPRRYSPCAGRPVFTPPLPQSMAFRAGRNRLSLQAWLEWADMVCPSPCDAGDGSPRFRFGHGMQRPTEKCSMKLLPRFSSASRSAAGRNSQAITEGDHVITKAATLDRARAPRSIPPARPSLNVRLWTLSG
jgi:hypothetical protein